MREHRLGQDVVREAVGHAGERVRRERRDDEEVPSCEMRKRVGARRRPPGERVEGLGATKRSAPARQHGLHLVSGAHEQPDERARLVGRYPAGDSEQDARHAPSAQPDGVRCLIFPLAISSIAIVR